MIEIIANRAICRPCHQDLSELFGNIASNKPIEVVDPYADRTWVPAHAIQLIRETEANL